MYNYAIGSEHSMKIKYNFNSISFKFLFVTAAVLLVSTVIGTTLIALNERSSLNHFLRDKGQSLGTYIANISKDPILLKDTIQLDAIVSEVNKDNDVVYALVLDAEGTYLTTSTASFNVKMPEVKELIAGLPKDSESKAILEAIKKAGLATELVHQVKVDASDQGKVLIGLSDAQIRRQLFKTILFVLTVNFSVMVVMGLLLFYVSKRLILVPIERLCEITAQVAAGDLSRTLEAGSNDELGTLTDSLNGMVGSLNQMVRQVNSATDELAIISENLSDASGKVVNSARLQADGVTSTSSAVVEINASIKGVAQNVENLSLSASESSSSILELSASVEEVALNTENLSQAVGNVSSSIIQMTSSIKQVGGGVSSLLEATNSTASSVMQMDVSIKQVEKNTAEASAISEIVRKDAELGKAAVEASITGINEIKKSSDVTFEVIKNLSQRANEIGAILSVIDDVAEQTNLLALNAAIIAAQAGEHGKGFAVVAGEIKELAERTRSSTREINKVIKGVQDETALAVDAIQTANDSITDGKSLAEKSGAALQKIYNGVQQATDQMQEIARATLEQSRGSQLIRNATEQISDMVNQIATATKEQAVGSDQIITATETMKQLTDQVRNAAREQSTVGSFIATSTENITGMISQVKRACEEQSRGSDQISTSVEDINTSARINLEATNTMNESVNSIFAQINLLKKEMSAFKV